MAIGTPYLKTFMIPDNWIQIVWLCGPLSGLLMQPLAGVMSDNCKSRYGRRRPFIVVGCVLVCISLLLVGYVRDLRNMFNDYKEHVDDVWSVSAVVAGFFLLDFSINIVQAASRALILDFDEEDGNSWASLMISLGNIVGYLMGSLQLGVEEGSQIKALISIAIVLLVVCCTVTCFNSKEEVNQSTSKVSLINHFRQLIQVVYQLPRQLKNVCMVQMFVWIGWFQFNFFSSELVKEIAVLNDEEDSYGVRLGSRALLQMSVFATVCAFVLPRLLSRFNIRTRSLWTYSLLVFACVMFGALPCFMLKLNVTTLITMAGFPMAVALWVPFSIIGQYLAASREEQQEEGSKLPLSAGTVLGIHNVAIVIPQIISSLGSFVVLSVLPNDVMSITIVWFLGGVSVLVGAIISRQL